MKVVPIRIWYAKNFCVWNSRCYACMLWLTPQQSLGRCLRQARKHVVVCTYSIGDWAVVEGEANEWWIIGCK